MVKVRAEKDKSISNNNGHKITDIHIGVTVRHAIKLYSCIRDKWLLFCCRSSSEKQKWLQAFMEERKMVIQDKNDGLEFPAAAKQLARVAARCQRRPPRKPRGIYSLFIVQL